MKAILNVFLFILLITLAAAQGPKGSLRVSPNYRPGPNYNVRGGSNSGPSSSGVNSGPSSGINYGGSSYGGSSYGGNSIKAISPGSSRPVGVGAFSLGGGGGSQVQSGRPSYGSSFGVNTGGAAIGRPQAQSLSVAAGGRPQQNAVYRGGPNSRPIQYQYNQ